MDGNVRLCLYMHEFKKGGAKGLITKMLSYLVL